MPNEPTNEKPLRGVLREVEQKNVGGFARVSEQRLARELRALALLLRYLHEMAWQNECVMREDEIQLERARVLANELEAM